MAFFLDSANAPRAKFPFTIAGSISGTMPTATDTLKSAAWPQFPVTLPLIARTFTRLVQLYKTDYETHYRNHNEHESNHHVSYISHAFLERVERTPFVELFHDGGNKCI
jgi:hypothetical protein